MTGSVPQEIASFLGAATPAPWAAAVAADVSTLLSDHANCELKAASTALGFIYRYADMAEICWQMSRLAREELRHYEQVRKTISSAGLAYERIAASRYAGELHAWISRNEPERLIDSLLVGAFIEARSCERFALLVDALDSEDLSRFYRDLMASESRHFRVYLELAENVARDSATDLNERIDSLRQHEADVATRPDSMLRIHSGPPHAADA